MGVPPPFTGPGLASHALRHSGPLERILFAISIEADYVRFKAAGMTREMYAVWIIYEGFSAWAIAMQTVALGPRPRAS